MNKKMLTILIGATLGTVAVAQVPGVPAAVPAAPVEAPVFTGQGNSLEREVTPLIREISRKKAILELRKLDREIEKLEEEALKAQAERESIASGGAAGAPAMGPMGGITPGVYNPTVVNPSAPPSLPSVMSESQVRVLMVYGFEDNLYAKIASGQQGGYVVKKGDVMPDGRVVLNVNPNFIEVGEPAKGKSKVNSQKIFVSSSVTESGNGNANSPSGMPQANNNQGSASLMATPITGAPAALSLPGFPR